MIDDKIRDPKDAFVFDLRVKIKYCLSAVFQMVPIQPYLNNALLDIGANSYNTSRINSCLIFISAMTKGTPLSADFHPVLEIILDISPDATSLLTKTCVIFLHDFIYEFYDLQILTGGSVIDFDAIYKWLACVPKLATEIINYKREWKTQNHESTIQDLEDTTINTTPNDYARLALFMMTAFSKALGHAEYISMNSDDTPPIEKGIDLCFEVMNRLKDNEEIYERICDVLHIIIHGACDMLTDKEKMMNVIGAGSSSIAAIFDHACNFLSQEDYNDHPLHMERIMNLLRSILERLYDIVLDSLDIGRLVTLASHGLLSPDEPTFTECHKVLLVLFRRPSTSICKKRPETDSIVVRLYNSHSHQIVKDCVDVILSQRKISFIKACGYMLRLMNVEDGYNNGTLLKFEKAHLYEIFENCHDEVNHDKSFFDDLTNIFNASNEEEAENMAISINSKLYKA
ncbi:hypothetical protein RF11_10381 [Thelohanellus kitauei]|uniref:Uncharacterized protein n=1 Tax=Thelohanellus kitauei TaxID=669202 RepID=A0A0C2J4B0_THEKT|nr:hypothetical protein RF11_10381 [Thelohanellus kitauei]